MYRVNSRSDNRSDTLIGKVVNSVTDIQEMWWNYLVDNPNSIVVHKYLICMQKTSTKEILVD